MRRAWAGCSARAGVAGAAAAMLLTTSTGARGDGGDASGAFDYGLSEMLAGRYATGCPALESSFRLDPRPGTLFTLADCDRKWGKTASALARFVEYLALYERMPADERAKGRERERATIATTERATLERAVPLLAVRLPNDAPTATRVWRDDVELTGPALAAKVPVDPGEHRVRTEMPDGRAVEQTVSVEGGEERTLVVALPAAVAEPALVAPRPKPSPAAIPPSAAPVPARPSHVGWVYAAAGVGVASLAVAGVSGLVALSQRSETSSVCNAAGECATDRGVNAGNEARTMANVETGALVVGGVAVAVAIVLWLTEPRAPRTSLVWAPNGVMAVW